MRQLKITKSITNRESASLDKYLQEIGKEELISVEEEVELAQRIRKGDQEAMERLTTKVTSDLSRLPRSSMRHVVLSLSRMLYGGFVSLSFRLLLSSRELYVCH